ncbi:fam-a protein [Plasmodium chabaudi chabaudi]|uniref:Fam-a protein n=1 Tax=Plasmodium chabaudi chabaudi TaxID=31271 RepID=A0A4V0K6G1_PLACU|nr:fam-a protein [Plasmodium chabaudi chabaudi]VTZ68208.1 fam-a protein [Plasmodium chabaudi chabaudi]|eukprot:XP_016653700.1 fam-a protein [Plasmodium chabaudi chabaudi]
MNKGYIKTVLVFLSLLVYVSNRALASESVLDVNNSNSVYTRHIASSNENHEKEDLIAKPDSEETKKSNELMDETEKATEIMDEVIYRLKGNADFNNGYNDYYLNDKRGCIAFTKYIDKDVGKFHLIIPDSNKYNDIINMLYEAKDLYSFCSIDSQENVVHEYYPNLIMLQRSYKNLHTSSNIYNFTLSATVKESEDITIIAKTSIDIYDDVNFDKKKDTKNRKKNTVKSELFFNDHIDFGNIARKIVLNKKFINEFGFVIKRESDHVGITYVEYKYNHHNRHKFCSNILDGKQCKKCRANCMIDAMNNIIEIYNY